MKNFSVTVIAVFIVLIGMIIGFSLEALIIWGIGNLILWLLNINFNWTFMYSLATAIILWIVRIELNIKVG